jgi:hypothetical protein
LLPREDFQTPPKVRALLGTQQSMQVLRNRLYQLKKDATRYEEFLSSVGFVLTDGREPIDIGFHADETRDVSLPVTVKVGPKDVFPETFAPFLLGNTAVRDVFMKHHGELLDAAFWQSHKERILAGYVHDVFPYEREKRFSRRQLAADTEAAA